MKIKKVNMIDVSDWDSLVEETYERPYSFQQQDGCKARGIFNFSVPSHADDFENDTVPEIINHGDMGVSFAAWLARDPNILFKCEYTKSDDKSGTRLWWERNFYPDMQMIANDLHKKGLLEAGDYTIDIDW